MDLKELRAKAQYSNSISIRRLKPDSLSRFLSGAKDIAIKILCLNLELEAILKEFRFYPIPYLHEIFFEDEHVVNKEVENIGPLVLPVEIDIWKVNAA